MTGDSPAQFTPRRVLKSPVVSGDPAMSQERLARDTVGFNFRPKPTCFSKDGWPDWQFAPLSKSAESKKTDRGERHGVGQFDPKLWRPEVP